jgi:hypothetical protein
MPYLRRQRAARNNGPKPYDALGVGRHDGVSILRAVHASAGGQLDGRREIDLCAVSIAREVCGMKHAITFLTPDEARLRFGALTTGNAVNSYVVFTDDEGIWEPQFGDVVGINLGFGDLRGYRCFKEIKS